MNRKEWNLEEIEKILNKELKGLNYEFYSSEVEFNLDVWDESRKLNERDIIEKVENCLWKIKDFYDVVFEESIWNDIWYSGFMNVDENELSGFCDNKLKFMYIE